MGLEPSAIEPLLARLLASLERWLACPSPEVLGAWRERDALAGLPVAWSGGEGIARGIDDEGRLLVEAGGVISALDAGEVRLRGGAR
jgi:biotin-(acetyl-CoA carboxylase) ligase